MFSFCSSIEKESINRYPTLLDVASWLKEHYREPMSVGFRADLAGMSPTSLHRHFKATTLMTPLEYRMHVRLHEARKLLLIGSSNARAVGFDVGYESQTQFTREYRRLFGRPPIQDIRLLKGDSPRAPSVDEGKAISAALGRRGSQLTTS